jgi:hypothetical protein
MGLARFLASLGIQQSLTNFFYRPIAVEIHIERGASETQAARDVGHVAGDPKMAAWTSSAMFD